MNRRHISEKIRLKVAARAHHQCEYCLIAEMFLATMSLGVIFKKSKSLLIRYLQFKKTKTTLHN
jgi:hypothetical protein